MSYGRASIRLVVWLSIAATCRADGGATKNEPKGPLDLKMEEKVAARLAQLDVTLSGPPGSLEGLTAKDFVLVVGGRDVDDLTVDGTCVPPSTPGSGEAPRATGNPAAAEPSYLFYFDQNHLTHSGRERGIDLARKVIPALVAGGARVRIVSSAASLKSYSTWTADPKSLLDALARLNSDGEQHGSEADMEGIRMAALENEARRAAEYVRQALGHPLGELDHGDSSARMERDRSRTAIASLARGDHPDWSPVVIGPDGLPTEASQAVSSIMSQLADLRREEVGRERAGLERLGATLTSLTERPSPKAILFFADTFRLNGGEHYLRQLTSDREIKALLSWNESGVDVASPLAGKNPADAVQYLYDDLLDAAATAGVRVYTVQAQGLLASPEGERDARDFLRGLAAETGGQAFLGASDASRIAHGLLADLSCYYVLSFKPDGFRFDEPLSVYLRVTRPKVHVRTRATIVIPSEPSRASAKLVAAFLDGFADDFGVHAAVIPLAVDKRALKGLLQVIVPAGSVPPRGPERWDLGATIQTHGVVDSSFSRRLAASTPVALPIVLERPVEIPARETVDITAVVHEIASDLIGANHLRVDGPPGKDEEFVGPTAILQPRRVVVLRDGKASVKSTAVALPTDAAVDPTLPVALVTVVCGADGEKVRVERTLDGERSIEFGSSPLDGSSGRCVQIRDIIPATTLGPGAFRYRIDVVVGTGKATSGQATFHVGASARPPVVPASMPEPADEHGK